MKVLFISHSSVIPNYREKLRLLARRKDLEITLLLPEFWPEAGRRIKTKNQPASDEGFRIISSPIVFEGRLKRHFYPAFGRIVSETRPDLIHIEEEPYSLAAWQAAKAARRTGAKLVFFTWENLLEKFGFPHQMIRSYVFKTAHHAIAGDLEAADLLRRADYPPSQITVLPQYGVNPILFKKKNAQKLKKQLKLGPFTAGYVGRLVAEKGVHHLLEAFALMRNHATTLLLVGSGPFRMDLEKKATQLGVAKRVRWIPSVDQNLIPDYLNCMDALVLPSLTTTTWKEQFGRVLIEAQACEVPVIGSDSGAIPEVIGKAGLIFPEGNLVKLSDSLHRLAASSTLRRSLGLKSRKQVLDLYTNQKIADKIYGIYRNVLKKR